MEYTARQSTGSDEGIVPAVRRHHTRNRHLRYSESRRWWFIHHNHSLCVLQYDFDWFFLISGAIRKEIYFIALIDVLTHYGVKKQVIQPQKCRVFRLSRFVFVCTLEKKNWPILKFELCQVYVFVCQDEILIILGVVRPAENANYSSDKFRVEVQGWINVAI